VELDPKDPGLFWTRIWSLFKLKKKLGHLLRVRCRSAGMGCEVRTSVGGSPSREDL